MANTTSAPIVEIVPDGDIILVVGSDRTKILVKSTLLRAASNPFSAMLRPNWKEGHDTRHYNGPFELPLPEDNATNDRIPQTLPASDILAIAVAADKYDCLLEEQRGFVRLQLADILTSGVNIGNCRGYCGRQARYTYAYIKKLDAEDL
ncbi:uncharacterized protein FPRO_07305 [Fusarium proliferatum ET1]|uniref:BTB domain-containing protein n=1 Tax=Fusarium proliferatum (strain ET1) TaxID=1227346 RepID=A0A1L7VTM8_FUSPR|nr:uncharacterized protein FPRO_07305 [Fusarium proliferatum ET1]CZR43778.1 uncharacterized protein FPRO_07305 [Fusarium proliferatum ET1]